MKAGTRLLASLSLCAVATTLAATLTTRIASAAKPPTGGNASANLDQCANGTSTSPVACAGTAWQNGNTNEGNAHWVEGDSIAYRLRMSNLTTAGTHTVTIEWDTTKGGKHALDYLTSYNRTEKVGNNPCSNVTGCGSPTTFDIPSDTNTGLNLPPLPDSPGDGRWNQVFTMFGGTIQAVSAYSLKGTYAPAPATTSSGDSSTSITITFTANVANPVLAWGAHVATRKDWGANNSAVAITGSPFHVRLLDLDGSGGNQDRSAASSAVVFPAILTVTKNVLGSDGGNLIGPTAFTFNGTSPSINNVPEVGFPFNLVNDGVPPAPGMRPANQKQFKLYLFGTTSPVTVTEQPTTGFALTGLECPATLNGVPDQTPNNSVNGATATIVAEEGQEINCTYTNQQYATLTVIKNVVKSNGGDAGAESFTLRVTGSNGTNLAAPGSASGTVYSLAPGTYTVSEDVPLLSGYQQIGFSDDCNASGTVVLGLGANKTCTITNHDLPAHLIVRKLVVNANGGTRHATDFSFSVNGGAPTQFAQDGTDVLKGLNTVDVRAGSFEVVETATPISGYTTSYNGCSGTISNGESKTCTITNTAQSGTLIVRTLVINDNGGTKQATEFSFQVGTDETVAFLQDGANVLAGKNTLTENAGTYTITAPAVNGYTTTYNNCADVVIANGATETCTIINNDTKATPRLDTTMRWVLHDSLTVTGRPEAPDASSATVTFKLFGPNDPGCTGTVLNGDNGSGETVGIEEGVFSTKTGFIVGQALLDTLEGKKGTFRWRAEYSGDAYNEGTATSCGEETHTITVGEPTPPTP
jgi:hypothetical protein